MLLVLLALVFFATFLVAAAVVFLGALFNAPQMNAAGATENSPLLIRTEPSSTLPVWRQLLERLNFTAPLERRIREAGLDWSAGRVSLAMLLSAALGFAVLFGSSWSPPGGCWVAAWLCGSVPYWLIQYRRRKRLRAVETQFPDALDSLSRAMRAGHALSSALASLLDETPEPLGAELRRLAEEHRLGLSWDTALDKFAARIPIFEARLFAAAVTRQTHTGGKLTEALERLSETIRESAALRGEVRAITAQARLSGAVLTALPFVIAVMLYMTSPDYVSLLMQDPRGVRLLWAAAGCLALGHVAIQHIVRLKTPL